MKRTILTLFSFAILISLVNAQKNNLGESDLNPIYTGIPSLSIAPDARGGSLGDVGAATSPDVFSQHWNPSKYAFMESSVGFAFSYTPWLRQLVDDINLGYVAGYWKLDDYQAFSASFRYFSLGKVTLRQYEGDPGFDARPNEFAVDLAYSRKLSEKFSASVAFRYIRGDLNVPASTAEDTPMYPANGFAVDISAYYRTPITMSTGDAILAFGGNISNIGNKISYDDGATYNYLPANLRLGGSFEYPFDNFNRLSINADVNKLLVISRKGKYGKEGSDEYGEISSLSGIFKSFGDSSFKEELQEITWGVGLEYSYNRQFFVRAGYFNEHKFKGGRKYFNAGVGFKLNVFQLDAGYVIATTPTNPLDQTLRFSLSFDLFGLKDLMN